MEIFIMIFFRRSLIFTGMLLNFICFANDSVFADCDHSTVREMRLSIMRLDSDPSKLESVKSIIRRCGMSPSGQWGGGSVALKSAIVFKSLPVIEYLLKEGVLNHIDKDSDLLFFFIPNPQSYSDKFIVEDIEDLKIIALFFDAGYRPVEEDRLKYEMNLSDIRAKMHKSCRNPGFRDQKYCESFLGLSSGILKRLNQFEMEMYAIKNREMQCKSLDVISYQLENMSKSFELKRRNDTKILTNLMRDKNFTIQQFKEFETEYGFNSVEVHNWELKQAVLYQSKHMGIGFRYIEKKLYPDGKW